MAYRLEISVDAERDFGLIFDRLIRSYLGFGESPASAFDRAEARIREIRAGTECVLTAPIAANATTTSCPARGTSPSDGPSTGSTEQS